MLKKSVTLPSKTTTYIGLLRRHGPFHQCSTKRDNQNFGGLYQWPIGQLHEQIDVVAMGSSLGPLMANVFMCHLEEKLTRAGLLHKFYKRYVDDTLSKMPSIDAADEFLTIRLMASTQTLRSRWNFPLKTRSHLSAWRLSRKEGNLKHKFMENRLTMAYKSKYKKVGILPIRQYTLSVLAVYRPFYISICISTLPTQHTSFITMAYFYISKAIQMNPIKMFTKNNDPPCTCPIFNKWSFQSRMW